MRTLQPVVWSKGTFLTPQHMQTQDRFLESVVQFRTEALHFRPWGFRQLQIDQQALAGGALGIHAASGLFPDGLPFDIPRADPAPPVKSLAAAFSPEQTAVDVHLAIPQYRESGVNLSAPERGLETRFLTDTSAFRDENGLASEKLVQVARKNLRLVAQGESMRGMIGMPVARVLRTAADTFQLDPHFVPPLLDFTASECLVSMTRRLLEILSAKSSMLSGARRQKNQSLAEFTVSDVANFWLLYTINQHLPRFRHLFETKHGHPEELFGAMLSLASALTTFSLETQPRDLASYDHDDLGRSFEEMDGQVRRLLDTVIPANFVSLPLKPAGPSVYAAAGFEDRYLEDTRLYLAIRADMNEGELIRKVPQLVKLCSATHIEHLIRQALPGVELTHVISPPTTIPVKVAYQYFSLSRSGLAWEAIGRARNFAAYIPGDFVNPQAELIVLLPQA